MLKNEYIYLEILKSPVVEAITKSRKSQKPRSKSKTRSKSITDPLDRVDAETIRIITDSVNDLADESGWTFLGSLGNFILKKKPDFDPRNFGFPKLLSLIKYSNKFEIDERDTGQKNVRHIYLKLK